MKQFYEIQDFIFESNPTRQDILAYNKNDNGLKKYSVYVYRNHSFELIEKNLTPYLDYANLSIDFKYSDYDDSLSFFDLDTNADLIILWLDLSRYDNKNVTSFIESRLTSLKSMYKKNILLVTFLGEYEIIDSQIVNYSIDKWKDSFNGNFQDLRLEKFSGTKMSMALTSFIAKDLGLNYFSSLLRANLKCIILDLDNTLYKGVLGEDGIQGVELTQGHNALQKRISELALSGFFVCIVSKNDQVDVDNLFKNRNDFSLKKEHLTIVKASWDPKAVAISEIATELNIGIDSILFIDDNLGELLSVEQVFPEIKSIFAKDDANITLDVLNNYPGLFKLGATFEDTLRTTDSQANAERLLIMKNSSKDEFIKQMEIGFEFLINPIEDAYRIHELANKTNQFIFNYKRYSKSEIEALILSTESVVVAVKVKDKLSESGIVGVIILTKESSGEHAILDECFVSCRALGRGLDNIIVDGAIAAGLKKLNMDKLLVSIEKGERNSPAISYFEANLEQFKVPMLFSYTFPTGLVSFIFKE